MKYFIKCCTLKKNWKRAIKVALVVGTILGIINHYDMFLYNTYTTRDIIQIIITYFVPFTVSLYSSAMYCGMIEKIKQKNRLK